MGSITKEIDAGKHNIKYTLPNYRDEEFDITVHAGVEKTYHKTLTSILPKGSTNLDKSKFPEVIFLETEALFSIFTENTGDVKAQYKITILFEAVAIVKEYNFESAWSTEMEPGKSAMIDLNIVLPSDAIPKDRLYAEYEISTVLEAR